jgi:hypothetical protein
LKNHWYLALAAGSLAIASFGAARFVKNSGGKIELVGGTADDHADAREWCSLFASHVVFTSVAVFNPRLRTAVDSTRAVRSR